MAEDDPAFTVPTKFVGPVYDEREGHRLARRWGWQVSRDGTAWRRVVASPEPLAVVELATIKMLLADGAVVICAGGGGIPVCRGADGDLRGVEAVVDKDLSTSLLARSVDADALLLLTDVPALELDFGTSNARPIPSITTRALEQMTFPPGSMGPKVTAACRFVRESDKTAAIGRLEDAVELLAGTKGTTITDDGSRTGHTYHKTQSLHRGETP